MYALCIHSMWMWKAFVHIMLLCSYFIFFLYFFFFIIIINYIVILAFLSSSFSSFVQSCCCCCCCWWCFFALSIDSQYFCEHASFLLLFLFFSFRFSYSMYLFSIAWLFCVVILVFSFFPSFTRLLGLCRSRIIRARSLFISIPFQIHTAAAAAMVLVLAFAVVIIIRIFVCYVLYRWASSCSRTPQHRVWRRNRCRCCCCRYRCRFRRRRCCRKTSRTLSFSFSFPLSRCFAFKILDVCCIVCAHINFVVECAPVSIQHKRIQLSLKHCMIRKVISLFLADFLFKRSFYLYKILCTILFVVLFTGFFVWIW